MAKKKGQTDSTRQLTCFVVIGFGRKTDHATGRVLDLDKTYEQLIRPAFDRVNVNCFRAIDANLTGSIDSIMYHWIFAADIVIADLSTLNANVFYELGVRHAQKPNTTIIISESVLMSRIPFDLGHFVVHQYHHGGDEIRDEERRRFVDHLTAVLEKIIAQEQRRLQQDSPKKRPADSPVYTFLQGMEPPEYESHAQLEPPPYVPPEKRAELAPEPGKSLASVIEAAEAAKQAQKYEEAIQLFERAIDMDTRDKEKPDVFLAQRLALVTYKHGERPMKDGEDDAEGELDPKVATRALHDAEAVLAKYCEPPPRISTDPETLGLSGAINKRLFEIGHDPAYLDKAIAFYERGFYVRQDYYNGINVAYMYTLRANLLADRFDSIVSYGHANMIRRKVGEICDEILADEAAFQERGDREWVLMTRAEVHQGLEETQAEERLAPRIEREASAFGKDAYRRQRLRLAAAIAEFKRRVQPERLGSGGTSPETSTE